MTGYSVRLFRSVGLLIFVAFLSTSPVVVAVEPGEIMADANLEARARAISANLRCLVCQNQSIDDSDADLARDLRMVVRDRLTKGDTDKEVFDFVVARYGEFVLLKPPFNAKTVLLWMGPAGVFLIGIIGVFVYFKRRGTSTIDTDALTADEERRLAALLEKETES